MTQLMEMISLILIFVAVTAIITSILVQLTKNTKPLDKIPTELEVIVLTMVIGLLGFFALCSHFEVKVVWYYVVAVVFLNFISAFVCMFGWDQVVTIINKFTVPKELRDIFKLTTEEKDKLDKVIEKTEEIIGHDKVDTESDSDHV